MPDYTALFLPGLTITLQAAAAITGGDPLEVAGNGTVQKCTAGPSGLGSAAYVGVAAHDAITGQKITLIAANPVHEGLADGVINAGTQVMASSVAGRQVKAAPATSGSPVTADVNAARAVIGVALTTAGDGNAVRWIQR